MVRVYRLWTRVVCTWQSGHGTRARVAITSSVLCAAPHTMPTVHEHSAAVDDLPTIDEEPEAASIPAPFEDVEEEGIEPLKTLLESLDEGRTTNPLS